MRAMFLLAEAEECTRLYLLQRGCLRLASSLSETGRRSKAARANERASGGDASASGGDAGAAAAVNRPSGMCKKMLGDSAMVSFSAGATAAPSASSARSRGKKRGGVGSGGGVMRAADPRGIRGTSFVGTSLTTFRMLEREGSMIGLSSAESSSGGGAAMRVPYSVEA